MADPTVEQHLSCAFADIGAQVGALIKCLVEQEMAAHLSRIQQLTSVLNGEACTPSQSTPQSEAPPAA